jgi:transglutaminase-like putative cysteine protease
MSLAWQIPRNCLAWILIAQLALILPHFERLPWWVLAVYLLCALWRIMIYQGRWSLPAKWLKLLLPFLCIYGIYNSYGTLVGLEPTVALLFSGFCLKLLEVSAPRDAYLIIFLAFFVAVTEFLFVQDFWAACIIFLTLLLIITALIALHQHSFDQLSFASFRKALVICSQAIPLMVLLFLVFPRFDPLWSVPLPAHQAKTGVTDTITPGDISNLSQSGALAFRVEFESEIPPRPQLYWRGLVLSEFDGRSWRQQADFRGPMREPQLLGVLKQMEPQQAEGLVTPIKYSIIQEPTQQPWLFALVLAYSPEQNIRLSSDYRLVSKNIVHSRIKYRVLSNPQAPLEPKLSSFHRQLDTALPRGGNPGSRQLANAMLKEAGTESAYVQQVLAMIRQQNFVYTLKPPLLAEQDSIDDFLFNTRRGFCSHYASSFVFLMRAAGIPARVVAGYQGGEVNPITGTVLVHQFDAHSWAEVWIAGRGWRRVDPTAAVAPDRIEFGLEMALQKEGSFLSNNLLSPMRYRNVVWLNRLRLQLDAFNYQWANLILQYRGEQQLKVLESLLGKVTPLRLGLMILGVGAAVLLLVALFLLKQSGSNKRALETKIYLRLCRSLERAGFVRKVGEGAIDFARRVAEQEPRWKARLLAVTRLYVQLCYQPLAAEQRKVVIKQLRKEAFSLRYQLKLA